MSLHHVSFQKNKKRLELVSMLCFLHYFFEKYFQVRFYLLTKFHYCLIAFTSWHIGQYVYWIYLFLSFWCHPVCGVINFAIEISFLSSCFPAWARENVRRKIYRFPKWKELRSWNKKVFHFFRNLYKSK